MFPLSEGPLPDIDVKNIIFITRPTLKLMDYIADNIHSEDKKKKRIYSFINKHTIKNV